MDATPTKELATLGKSVMIKGELSGSEDLYIDGQVEGTIDLKNFSLTVGPNGKVKANINAKASEKLKDLKDWEILQQSFNRMK